jgi:hypothetical protein
MLILNTTIAETGIQAVIAPVEGWKDTVSLIGNSFDSEISPRYDVPLSTAVGLSARFTAVAPAGHHIDRGGPNNSITKTPYRLVDGGYIDNSGVETAMSVVRAIASVSKPADGSNHRPVSKTLADTHILIIGNPAFSYFAPKGLDEIASPVAAMYNSRVHRAKKAIDLAKDYDTDAEAVGLAWNYFAPPLGWVISPYTLETIGAHVGEAERCIGPAIPYSEANSLGQRAASIARATVSESWGPRDRSTNLLQLWHRF